MFDGDDDRRQLFRGQSAAADLCSGVFQHETEFASQRRLKLWQYRFADRANLIERTGEGPQRRNRLSDVRRLAVESQSRFQRGQSQLAATQARAADDFCSSGRSILFADHQSRLRAAENLVAAKSHYVGAGLNAFGDDRFLRQAVSAQIDQRAAAQIFHDRNIVLLADGDQLIEGHFGSEADDFVVARVNFQQSAVFR